MQENSPTISCRHKAEPASEPTVYIHGSEVKGDSRAFWTFFHLIDFYLHILLNGEVKWKCGAALKSFEGHGKDIVFVIELTTNLSSLIAGDYKIPSAWGNIVRMLDVFPTKLVETVEIPAEIGEESTRLFFRDLEDKYKEGIENGRIFMISRNALNYWRRFTTPFPDPTSTFWNVWHRDVSRQMLGEAVGFKLCTFHSMTVKAIGEFGCSERQILSKFRSVVGVEK